MKEARCPEEERTLASFRSATWDEALSAHVAGCAVCAEIAQVSRWLQSLAGGAERARTLPDASRLWRRAQLAERNAKAERAQKALDRAEAVLAILAATAVAAWLGWNWDATVARIASLYADVWQQFWVKMFSVAGAGPGSPLFGVAILSLVAIALAYPFFARD